MQLLVNGAPLRFDGGTIADLLQHMDLIGRRLAVEVNQEIIPRGQHAAHALADGDVVEIVHAIGGG